MESPEMQKDDGGSRRANLLAYTAAADAIQDPVMIIGPNHHVIHGNRAAQLLLKDSPQAEPVLCSSLCLENDGLCNCTNSCPITRAWETKSPVSELRHLLNLEGNSRTLLVSASPVIDSSGEVECIIETVKELASDTETAPGASRSREYLKLLRLVSRLTCETHDIREIVDSILAETLDSTGAQAGMLLLGEELGEKLLLEAHKGLAPEYIAGFENGADPNRHDFIFQVSNLDLVKYTQSGFPSNGPTGIRGARGEQINSFVGAPLNVGNRVIGVLAVFSFESKELSPRIIPWIEIIALHAATTIQNSRSQQLQLAVEGELFARERYLDCLTGISSQLLSAPDPWKLMPGITRWLQQAANVSRCLYFEIERNESGQVTASQRFEAVADGVEPITGLPALQNLDLADSSYADAADTLSSGNEFFVQISDVEEPQQNFFKLIGAHKILAVPIMLRDELTGVIVFAGLSPSESLGDRQATLLRSASNAISSAMERVIVLKDLQAAHTQLKSILESSTGYAIIATDPDFKILHYNYMAEDLFGHSASDAIGRTVSRTRVFEGTAAENPADIAAATQDKGVWDFDIEITDPHGEILTVHVMIAGMYNAQDLQTGYTFFCRDVTEKREAERQMVERQRMESVGLLAGGIAHDFNNILMGILGYASLAKDRVGEEHPAHRMVNIIETSAERAAALTRELLAYARGGKSQSVYLRLDEQVDEILNILGTNLPKSVNLARAFTKNLPYVEADPAQLQQVIMNLCINAGDAIKQQALDLEDEEFKGVIKLTTSVRRLEIADKLHYELSNPETPSDFVCLEVVDNGCGMEEETLQRIFQPFFTTKITGRGLGLAAAEGIIRNHGGCLQVTSQHGTGSKFLIMLPADHSYVETEEVEELMPLGGSETVLVIDDEEVNRQLALLTLTNIGHRVLLAEDARQGLEVFERERREIDLVLLDLTMPGMSGDAALRQFQGIRRDVPIVLTSGFDEQTINEQVKVEGVAGFIQKPYTPEVLARAVRKVLDREAGLDG